MRNDLILTLVHANFSLIIIEANANSEYRSNLQTTKEKLAQINHSF